eukprot:CAMPEP_0198706544 /NCGR_PEP_ID=MMETSP1468-20131203/391023_1 /TAXON_ID=1461545 /ORGANISM="Mantoniella sp, Strain CCMP1436" /LENGTH=72 /DNA_ID=CAMNT_0044465491 /DNA_START=786 /DNA_END=1000 /DNA_ORIENTATION=+
MNAKQRWLSCAMHVATTPQWWSNLAMQYPHSLQCDARGGRQILQVVQYLKVWASGQNSGVIPPWSSGPSGSS